MAPPQGPTAAWFAFLEEGRFMIQRSPSTGQYVFYPRMMAPGSGAADLEWVEASGRGTVYSTTVMRERPPKPDQNVALVDLEEGPRMMTRIEGIAPDQVKIGMKVMARIVRPEGQGPVVVFEPEQA